MEWGKSIDYLYSEENCDILILSKSLITEFLKAYTNASNKKLSTLSVMVNIYPFLQQIKKEFELYHFEVFWSIFTKNLDETSVA